MHPVGFPPPSPSAAFLGAASGEVGEIANFLALGGDIDAPESKSEETLLMVAVKFRRRNVVEWLLGQGADINRRDRRGTTAFMFAAAQLEADYDGSILRLLAAKGANVNARNIYGETALFHALRTWEDPDLLHDLVECGVDPNLQNYRFKTAVEAGRRKRFSPLYWVSFFMKRYANVDFDAESRIKKVFL